MDSSTIFIAFYILFVIGVFLMVAEVASDGMFKSFRCKFGLHKFYRMSMKRRKRYYCQFCKTPRRHPELKVIDGGNKVGNIKL